MVLYFLTLWIPLSVFSKTGHGQWVKNTLTGAWTGSFREGHDAQEAKIMNWVLCFVPVAGLLARNLVLSTISLVLGVAREHNYVNQCCEWVLTQCFRLCCDHKNHLKCLRKKIEIYILITLIGSGWTLIRKRTHNTFIHIRKQNRLRGLWNEYH